MTNDNILDQTICNLPFEVVAIYDNSSQILQHNANSNVPPPVNVKIRIRNKEDTGKGRHGIISVPKLTAKTWPKRVRLVNSAQTIMSFNLEMEPNSDEAPKKTNRSLFQIFRPGGCLSTRRDEDRYSYLPSTSNDLNRKSTSGIEDNESSKFTGVFALKKNDFSSSYTNTLKAPKTFLGKCKPGGCLDPPFSEDKYTYKPTIQDDRSLQQPDINTNSLHSEINILDTKTKSTTQDQQINILHQFYPETTILGNTETLVTYPPTLSSSKDSQIGKPILRMLSEQVELSRKLTNECPEAYFIPPRKEKPKNGKNYDKNNYEEKEPKIKEAYINKDYILQSQTPSELLSDVLTITSQSTDEPLRGLIKEKQMIRKLNSTTTLLLKSEEPLNNKTSKDNIKTISTTLSAKSFNIVDNIFLQDQKSSNHNKIPIIKNIFTNIKENENGIYKHMSRLNSSIQADAIQETAEEIKCIKNADPNNISNIEEKHQSTLFSLDLSNEISTKPSKSSIDPTGKLLDHFEIREKNNLHRQRPNVFNNNINNAKKTDIKQQIGERSEEKNLINLLKVKKSDSLEYEYDKNISEQVISDVIIKDGTNNETDPPKSLVTVQSRSDEKNININKNSNEKVTKNISETSKLPVQVSEFKDNDIMEELVYQGNERITKQIIDIHPSVAPDILPKVTSLHSSEKVLSLKNLHSVLISPKNSYVNQKDPLLSNISPKSKQLTNEKYKTDKHNEKKRSFDILSSKNMLSSSLRTEYTSSQKTEIDTINDHFGMTLESQEKKQETSSKHDNLCDTDIRIIPQMLQFKYPSSNQIELDKDNRTISQQELTITSKIKTSKDTGEIIKNVPQSFQEFTDFDSLQYRSSLNYRTSKQDTENVNTFINDSKTLLLNLKSDINISKIDNMSDDNFCKPSYDSKTLSPILKSDINISKIDNKSDDKFRKPSYDSKTLSPILKSDINISKIDNMSDDKFCKPSNNSKTLSSNLKSDINISKIDIMSDDKFRKPSNDSKTLSPNLKSDINMSKIDNMSEDKFRKRSNDSKTLSPNLKSDINMSKIDNMSEDNFRKRSNDSKTLLSNLKSDINISKIDIMSDDKFRKPSNDSKTLSPNLKSDINMSKIDNMSEDKFRKRSNDSKTLSPNLKSDINMSKIDNMSEDNFRKRSNDSKTLLSNLKSDINISKIDIISDDKFRKPSNDSKTLSPNLKSDINMSKIDNMFEDKFRKRSNDSKTLSPNLISDINMSKIDNMSEDNFRKPSNDSKTLSSNLKSDINISKIDNMSEDKFRKPSNDSKTLSPNLKSDINMSKIDNMSEDKFRKPSNEMTKNSIKSLQTIPNNIFHQKPNKKLNSFLEGFNKSELYLEASEKKTSQKFYNVQELKIIDPRPEFKKPFTRSSKNINSISSIAINFGFHSLINEKTGCSIETFDPSTSLASYPQDKIVTIKTTLGKNNSEIKVKIDSETDLIMQIKLTRQLDESRKLSSKVLNSDTNDRRRDNIRVYSSEISINKDKLLQETLKAVYETLMPIEKNIIKLKEEAESLYREQLLLKEVLFSKEVKANIINPNVRTCSCLQREIGLE